MTLSLADLRSRGQNLLSDHKERRKGAQGLFIWPMASLSVSCHRRQTTQMINLHGKVYKLKKETSATDKKECFGDIKTDNPMISHILTLQTIPRFLCYL